MISVSEKLLNKLIENDIICKEDKEIYLFGYMQLIRTILNITTTLIIGCLLHMILESIVFLICTILVRTYSGGYHAQNPLKCYVISTLIVIVALLFVKYFEINIYFYVGILIISTYILYIYAPVGCKNKALDNTELIRYKKILRTIIILLICVFIVFMKLDFVILSGTISVSFLICSILLIINKLYKNI